MGAAFGAALVGTRPIVEMRFADFALCATDELVNQIAKARFMFGGQSRAPMVIRKPMGMWRSSAAQHSQSAGGLVCAYPRARRRLPQHAAGQLRDDEGRHRLRRSGGLSGAQEHLGATRARSTRTRRAPSAKRASEGRVAM
jgi:hypothetical protein